jgi:signal transduction histidine kinase
VSGQVWVQYPLPGGKDRNNLKGKSALLSAMVHVAILALIVMIAAIGSSLTRRAPTVGQDILAELFRSHRTPTQLQASVPASPSAVARPDLTQGKINDELAGIRHKWKDAIALAVCLLAASLWWLVRPPSAQPKVQPERTSVLRSLAPFAGSRNADEQERKQISRDLHDSVGQVLTAAGLELAALRTASLPPEQVRQRLDSVSQLNAEALRLVRDLAMGLRPALLDDVGLSAALRWQVRQFSRRTGIPGFVELSGEIDTLPEVHRTCIYRCVQEALTNCARHSRAGKVEVRLFASGQAVHLTVEDDGVGLSSAALDSPGLGILGMHERVEAFGGSLTLGPRRQGGTRLQFEMPVAVEAQI